MKDDPKIACLRKENLEVKAMCYVVMGEFPKGKYQYLPSRCLAGLDVIQQRLICEYFEILGTNVLLLLVSQMNNDDYIFPAIYPF